MSGAKQRTIIFGGILYTIYSGLHVYTRQKANNSSH